MTVRQCFFGRRLFDWWSAGALLWFLGCSGDAPPALRHPEASTGGEDVGDPLAFDDMSDFERPPRIDHGTQSAIEMLGMGPPDDPWESMNYEARKWYMIGKFLPVTAELFARDLGRDRYAEFSCVHCHGADGPERGFAMPSANRMAIPPPGTPEHDWMMQSFPDMVEFMATALMPAAKQMLGWSQISCYACHPAPR
ncbi:MAG: hypothetical protein AAF550_04215 [Myxococcota bacterium]